MFEPEACVADWERTGRVPVPAALLVAPDLTEQLAAGPPPVDEIPDSQLLAPPERHRGRDGEGTADGDRPPHAREGGADFPDWAGLAPGVALAEVLASVDVGGLSEFDLVEAVARWEPSPTTIANTTAVR